MEANTEAKELENLTDTEIKESHEMSSLKKETDLFVRINEINESIRYYRKNELNTILRKDILEGRYDKNAPIVIYSKDKDGKWDKADSNLFQFAKSYFKLRILYQPVWAHAMAGLKWGAILGIGIKLLDSTVMLGMVDPVLAFMFLGVIAVCFIPRIGFVAVIIISIAMVKFTNMNLFMMFLSAALVGAILGCLPGMTIGGIIGLVRNKSIIQANDAAPEPEGMFYKAVLLPLLGGGSLIAFYLFVFNPWLVNLLG